MDLIHFLKIEFKDIKLGSKIDFYLNYIYLEIIKNGFRDFLKPFLDEYGRITSLL
jgi:hypothetical protein